jgi:hypothetical protein
MKATGYQALVDRFSLVAFRRAVTSWIHDKSGRLTERSPGCTQEYYPARYDPGEGWEAEFGFALRHEGVELQILAPLFKALGPEKLAAWVRSSPTGKYARIAWFLYEWMSGEWLPLDDLDQGNYVPALDPERYYSVKGVRVRRQRVINNLPGNPAWCPTVRRTPMLRDYEAADLSRTATERIRSVPDSLLTRAASYLYTRETKSSFAIERLTPDSRRAATFVELLRLAGTMDVLSEDALVRLQRSIVEERYADSSFRTDQNYIGESLGPTREWVHYVPPQPQDLGRLMGGWMAACAELEKSSIDAVVAAAVEGFGFVFLHPFDDGNGRIHRFLIHHVLAKRGFTPAPFVFPVSAAMLKERKRYDECLESYSRQIAPFVEYRIDDKGEMTVLNETAWLYRFPDLTLQTEALYGFIRDTVETELAVELDYLEVFDAARRKMIGVVDMPDRRLDLFIRLCLQGKGRLSASKRPLFSELSDDELARLQTLVYEELSPRIISTFAVP